MGFKWMPTLTAPANINQPKIYSVEVASQRSNSNGNEPAETLQELRDYKIYHGHKPTVHRFYRIGKYNKSISQSWIPNESELDDIDKFKTTIRINNANYNFTDEMGVLYVTYYIAFKGQRFSTPAPTAQPPQEKSEMKSEIMDYINSKLNI